MAETGSDGIDGFHVAARAKAADLTDNVQSGYDSSGKLMHGGLISAFGETVLDQSQFAKAVIAVFDHVEEQAQPGSQMHFVMRITGADNLVGSVGPMEANYSTDYSYSFGAVAVSLQIGDQGLIIEPQSDDRQIRLDTSAHVITELPNSQEAAPEVVSAKIAGRELDLTYYNQMRGIIINEWAGDWGASKAMLPLVQFIKYFYEDHSLAQEYSIHGDNIGSLISIMNDEEFGEWLNNRSRAGEYATRPDYDVEFAMRHMLAMAAAGMDVPGVGCSLKEGLGAMQTQRQQEIDRLDGSMSERDQQIKDLELQIAALRSDSEEESDKRSLLLAGIEAVDAFLDGPDS